MYNTYKSTKFCKYVLTCTIFCTNINTKGTKNRAVVFGGAFTIVQFLVLVKSFVQKGVYVVAKLTDFGADVKRRLIGHSLDSQEALAKEVSKRTGLSVDGALLSNVLSGRRNSPKIVQAIREILDIPVTPQK